MANLEITPCYRETGRQRYRLSQRARIPFDHDNIALPPLGPALFAPPETTEGEGTDTETFLGLFDTWPDASSDPEDGNEGDAAITAAADGHEVPHDESDTNSTDFWLEDSSEESDEDPNEESDRDDFPAVSQWRLNLTALSQRYNLYFVAYRNSIHVSRPRSCVTHSLPAVPDLVLAPAASRRGLETIGAMDVNDGHQVNHLIIGLLGEAEILLMAYDDGDVIGYYTKQIEDTVGDSHSPVEKHDLTPFFHENVGRSAWGLAIHQKSRLIAVGSNAHAATIFAPALTGVTRTPCPKHSGAGSPASEADDSKPEGSIPGFPPPTRTFPSSSMFRVMKKDDTGQVIFTDLDFRQLRNSKNPAAWDSIRASYNLRVEMTTGDMGHNIPNLTFISDEEGYANSIVAVDVLGNLWVMDFMFETPHIKIPGIHMQRILRGALGEPVRPMGWGVLSIPESCFLPTKDFRDTLGLHEEEARFIEWRGDRWIDISRGIQRVPNNSTVHRWSRRPNTAFQREHSQLVEMHPWFGSHEQLEFPPHEWGPVEPQEEEWFQRDGSSILRTYETDFELRPFEEGGIGVMYEHPMTQSRRPTLGPARLAMERLGNLLLVPELSLVVGASMSGRVALVTLTRPEPAGDVLGLKRGFKIEAILPTEQDEDQNLRPLCPLYGVAVGPLPQTPRGKMAGQDRYRLMIHYYDLSILSYEISRDPGTKELSVLTV